MANELQGAISRLLSLLRTYISGLSFAGTARRLSQNLFARVKESSLTFSGKLSWGSYEFSPLVTGALSFAGRLIKEAPLYGLLYRVLSLFRTKSGILTTIGNVIGEFGQRAGNFCTGIINSVGSISRKISKTKSLSGNLTLSGGGDLWLTGKRGIKLFFRSKYSNLTLSGTLTRTNAKVSSLRQGVLSLAGEIFRSIFSTQTGTVTLAGEVLRGGIEKIYTAAGVLVTAGAILRNIIVAKAYSGVLTFSGQISGVWSSIYDAFWGSGEGTLTLEGSIGAAKNLTDRIVSGVLTPIGRLTLIDAVLDRISAASLTITGVLTYIVSTTRRTIQATLDFSGLISNILKTLQKTRAGVLTLDGSATGTAEGLWHRTIESFLDFVSTISHLLELLRTYTGTITLSGITTRLAEVSHAVSGAISFAGEALAVYLPGDWRTGILSFAGTPYPYLITTRTPRMSTLTMTGRLTRHASREQVTIDGTLTLNGVIPYRWRDELYYGPPNP